jgi:O-antigen ligase
LICAVVSVPLILGGLVFLQQKRQVSFFDSSDDSTTWRTRVWKEGVQVLIFNPRHLAVGIGMDSLKTHWQDWGMFDNGRQPIGHLHSDYLQLAFERGVPTLIAWLAWMIFYLQLLWKNIRTPGLDWPARGLLIGAFGGTIGFLTSGLVHYNWGDSEDVMILFLIMGISLAVIRTRAD